MERYDHHILPFKKTQTSNVAVTANIVPLADIGALRLREHPNGEISANARLFRGVKIRVPGEESKTVDTLPNAQSREEVFVLTPGQPVELERPRFARGKSTVIISLRGT